MFICECFPFINKKRIILSLGLLVIAILSFPLLYDCPYSYDTISKKESPIMLVGLVAENGYNNEIALFVYVYDDYIQKETNQTRLIN